MKIVLCAGTRPEIIKLAPVLKELRSRPKFLPVMCVTAQHRELLDQALETFAIKPDYDLDIMTRAQTPDDVISHAIIGVGGVLDAERPDMVMVQGDTTTAMVSALAAYHRKIPVAHVEAGLRTGDKYAPFPEEMNRRLIGQIANYHFAPTPRAADNLEHEGIDESIAVVGNTAIDALLDVISRPDAEIHPLVRNLIGRVILVTAHRRESFGGPLANICQAIADLAEQNQPTLFVWPVHPNPNVREQVYGMLAGRWNVLLIPPLDYVSFCHLMKKSYLILTDSGGIQEEAPSLDVPVLVMRDITERLEAIEAGCAQLVGTRREDIVTWAELLLHDGKIYERMAAAPNPFGDGHAARGIVKILEEIA